MATSRQLAARLMEPPAAVETECERLVRRRLLIALRPPDLEIIRALGTSPEPMATSQLQGTLSRSDVYRRCRRLEALGLVDSRRRKGEQFLYFSPVTGGVMTEGNFLSIQEVNRALKTIIESLEIPRGVRMPAAVKERLREAIRRYLGELAASASDGEREQLERFERELRAILEEGWVTKVIGSVGLRPFRPWIREWWLVRGRDPMGRVAGAIVALFQGRSGREGALSEKVYILRPARLSQ